MADRRTVRELIEEGLSTTESLISQKDYTQAMICSRQTLEFLVRSLCRRNSISDSDPEQMVESLYLGGIISKEVCGEFFKIYKFGELAAVQGYNDTFSANESYRLLSQAVYAYQQMLQSQTMHRNSSPARRSARRKVSGGTLNQLPPYVKFGLPLVILLFLIFLVRSFAGHRKASEPVTTTEAVSSESSAAAELTTEAETTSAVAPSAITVYTTSSSLNVRETPSTSGKLLTTLPAGTVLDFVEKYNDQWTVINYNGTHAYVASQYVTASEVNPAERGSASATKSSSQSSAAETEPALGSTASGTTAANETSAQKAQSSAAKSSTTKSSTEKSSAAKSSTAKSSTTKSSTTKSSSR